jgi:hypothetical protein
MRTPLLVAFFLSRYLLLSAQEDLTVLVTNLQNQPVPQALVQLKNSSRGFEQTLQTDAGGKAVFRSIPAVDGYQLFIPAMLPYEAANSELIDLRPNQSRLVHMMLVESTQNLEAVTVTAGASAAINRMDAEVSFELAQQEIQSLPLEGRDITRLLYRLPNVSQATGFYPEAPNVSINGANPLFTSYLIDGMDNNERFLGGQKFAIPTGFTREVSVLTNNYSAAYGLTGNGVVNITTPSGTNEFSGEAFLITRPGPPLDASTAYYQRDLSGNAVKDGFRRYQAGTGFGGALKKDKTFYYLNAEHTTDRKDNLLSSPALGVNETVRGENRFTYLSGKLDHHWSARLRTSVRANAGIVSIERQGGGLEGGVLFPSAANTQDRNSLLLAAKNSWLGDHFSMETNLQYARFRWNYGRALNGESPQVTVLDPQEQAVAILGHPGYVFDALENTIQFLQKFNYYAGRHTLRGGLGLISSDHSLFGGDNASGNYTVKLTAQQLSELQGLDGLDVEDIPATAQVLNYQVELRPASFGARQTIYSFYMEDQFAVSNRMNLTLGIRYDYDNLSRGGSDKGDYNNIAPRLNVNYQLSQRSVLRGGYGMFYDKILYAVYSDALQQNTTSADYRRQLEQLVSLGILPAGTDIGRITFDGNLSGSAAGVPYLQGPSYEMLQGQRAGVFSNERRILNPSGYQNPYTHQMALGYQLQVDERRLFYVDLVHNRSYRLFRLRNLNSAAPWPLEDPGSALVRTPAQADASRPVPIYAGQYTIMEGDTVYGVARNVVMSETEGQSRYYGASFNLQQQRAGGRFSWRVNYTLSLLENNTEDINFRAMDSNDFASEWGPSINDRRHLLNGIVSYYPFKRFGVTLAALIQSGQPVNRIPDALRYGTTDLNGDGASFGDAYVGNSDRHPGESRNSDRLPWSEVLDLALQYELELGGNALEIRADVFNLLNTVNLSGYSNNATQSNQIQVGGREQGIVQKNAGAPRQFQFGLRWKF